MSRLLPLLLLLASTAYSQAPQRAEWRGERIDGVWRAETIDGRPVGRARYTINVAEGRVTGGHDGCNAWGFQWEDGERHIVSTLIGCPPDPLHEAYWAVVGAEPWAAELRANGQLRAQAAGHSALFRRAELKSADGD